MKALKHKVRVELVKSRESNRKNGRAVDEILDAFEVDCSDMSDGTELMEEISAFIEDGGGEIADDED